MQKSRFGIVLNIATFLFILLFPLSLIPQPIEASSQSTTVYNSASTLAKIKATGSSRRPTSPHDAAEVNQLRSDLGDGAFTESWAHSMNTKHNVNTNDSADSGTNPPLHLSSSSGNVMQTDNIYVIFWLPSSGKLQDGTTSTSMTSGYSSFEDQFLNDFTSTPLENIATEYYDNQNGHINQYAPYFQGYYIDQNAYPNNSGGACSYAHNTTNCINDSQLVSEILSDLGQSANSWWGVGGLNNEYIVYTSDGENTCYGSGSNSNCSFSNSGYSSQAYCGYHLSYYDSSISKNLVYAQIPYISSDTSSLSYNACVDSGYSSPNSNVSKDMGASITSHELMESMTDPLGNAWVDNSTPAFEIGDLCAGQYTSLSVVNGTGTDNYEVQKEWANSKINNGSADGCTFGILSNNDTLSNNIINGTAYQTKIVQTGSYPNQTTTSSIVATNPLDGTQRWDSASVSGGYKTVLTNSHSLSQSDPVLDSTNGLLYIETYDGYYGHGDLIAVNATTGVVEHDFSLTNVNESVQPVLDSSNNIYIFGTDNKIYCYAKDGTSPLSGWPYTTTISGSGGNPQFVIDSTNKVLYYPSDDGYVYGVYDALASSPATSYHTYNSSSSGYSSTYGKVRMNYAPSLDSSGNVYFGTRQTSYPYSSYVLSYSPSGNSLNWHNSVGS